MAESMKSTGSKQFNFFKLYLFIMAPQTLFLNNSLHLDERPKSASVSISMFSPQVEVQRRRHQAHKPPLTLL